MPSRRRLLRSAAALAALLPPVARVARAAGAPLALLLDDDGRRLSVVDAATLEPLRRWPVDGAAHGEPALTPDGREAFLALRDGAIARYDLGSGARTARVQAGADPRGLALSGDGQWLLAAHADALTVFDRELQPLRRYRAASLDGKLKSPVAAVFHAAGRRSFIVAFDALPELWEISYDRAAPPIFDGLVHDYRMGESIASSGFLGVRRTPLEEPFTALALDGGGQRHVLGFAAPDAALDVVNLDVRRRIARLADLPCSVAPAAFAVQGRTLAAVAGTDAVLRIAEAGPWRLVRSVALPGRPLFVHTQARSPHLWVGLQLNADEAMLAIVDKASLAPAGSAAVRGRLLGDIALSRDGSQAWATVRREHGDGLALCPARPPHAVRWLPTAAAPRAWAL